MPAPLRILFRAARYWPAIGGAELHTRRIVQQLQQKGHHVSIIRHWSTESHITYDALHQGDPGLEGDGDMLIYQMKADGIERWLIPKLIGSRVGRFFNRFVASSTIRRQLQKMNIRDYDIIHIINNGYSGYILGFLSVAKQLNIPFVITPILHMPNPNDTKHLSTPVKFCKEADAVIAMSRFESDWLIAQGVGPDKVHVIPIGPLIAAQADPASFRQKYAIGAAPMILFVARQVKYKGYQQLCQAAQKIWIHHPDAFLVFVGPLTEESTLFFAEYQHPQILNLGEVNLQEKTDALAACDILCVPSLEESLGGVYLEAWSFQKPVVAADIPALNTVISQGKDGFLVAQDPEPIAEILVKLLTDPALRNSLGQQGYQKVTSAYDWALNFARLEDLYYRLVEAKSSRRRRG